MMDNEMEREGASKPRITITKEDLRSVPDAALRRPPRVVEVRPIEGLKMSGKAITALVFGLAGIPLMGLLIGPFAIIFGGWALYEIGRVNHLTGKNLAYSGIFLGIFDIILWIFIFLILWMRSRLHL
jgi:hypothetical protein